MPGFELIGKEEKNQINDIFDNGGGILFNRVSQMMGLTYPFLLIISSGILATLLGAIAGLSGYYIKEVFNDN